ncbi:YdcF family protein [Pseudonocardia sp. TRM90224]|uniref:YdcF family protein n=1 Tax=Pseudonocardia sp. TRM90224 TaxID=2812678 RepID=UPI0027DEF460|nr:YdcF family protein [Pseudonocardia sp. TRM90224]
MPGTDPSGAEPSSAEPTRADWADAQLVWDFHLMCHELTPCDLAIGLGSHDIGVAVRTAELFHAGLFPLVVFTGDTSPSTRSWFPRGEAVQFRERALELGVPDTAILVEDRATHTGENFVFTRELVAAAGLRLRTALVICKPYMQRRAFVTAAKVWPEIEVRCASDPAPLPDYAAKIGDARLVIDNVVGDLQRILEYPKHGFAAEQDVPLEVEQAYSRLVDRGYTSRLVRG